MKKILIFIVFAFFCFTGCGEIQGQETSDANTDLLFTAENIIEENVIIPEFTVLTLDEAVELDNVQTLMTSINFELSSEVVSSDEFVVNIAIKNTEDLFGAAYRVYYDGLALSVVNVEAGGFLGKAGETAFMYAVGTELSDGKNFYKIVTGYTRLGKEIGGVSGDGILAKIKFKILAKGETKLSFGRVDFRHPNLSVVQVKTQAMTLKIE